MISDKLWELKMLGQRIIDQQIRGAELRNRAKKVDSRLTKELDEPLGALNNMKLLWNNIISKIRQYENYWSSLVGKSEISGVDGLGFIISTVTGIAAVGALAYVAVQGMGLLEDYATQKDILDRIEKKVITAEQGSELIKSSKPLPESLISVGSNIMLPVTVLIVIGLAGYFYVNK